MKMGSMAERRQPSGNALLDSLDDDAWRELAPQLQGIEVKRKEVVGAAGHATGQVLFPCGAVLSVLTYMQNGAAVEVATVGREGLFGIELVLGASTWGATTVCQIEGPAWRMSASNFRAALEHGSPLRSLAQRYVMAYLSLVSQSVACNRLHNIEERFARWVLMTHDRVAGDTFFLTQEFIADMLGVHRPSVSLVAGAFQQAGFIKYSRGTMTILNREGLEEASCECYAVAGQAFERLGGSGSTAGASNGGAGRADGLGADGAAERARGRMPRAPP
ncbi:MAG: Crp/Fnr family transcriptional regulator [Massilia sp.]